MKILLINHYAGSIHHGMEYRPYYLAKQWIKDGHEVTIVAASNSHVRQSQPNVTEDMQTEVIDGINYIWLKTPKYDGNGFGRIINMLCFVKALYCKASYLVSTLNPDNVIASSTYPLDIFPARFIAKKTQAKLVFEIHDLWPLSPMELGGFSKWHPFIIMMQIAENFAFKHSDKVVSILPFTEKHCLKQGLQKGKFCHIPNGIVIDDWKENEPALPEELQNKITQLRNENFFLVGYAGGLGLSNAMETFILADKHIQNKKIALIIIGKGPEKEKLVELAKGKTNIHILPAVNKQQVRTFLKQMDTLFLGLKNSSLYRFGLGLNKFFDYMMARKPIVCAVGHGKDSLEPAKCVLCCKPEDPQAIAQALDQISKYPETKRLQMAQNGYDYVRQHHDYEILAKQFITALQN